MDIAFALPADMFMFFMGFLFIFAVIYGLLGVAKLFENKVNVVLALVFAAVAAMYIPFLNFIFLFIPVISIILVIVFFIVFMKKLFKKEKGESGDLLPVIVSLGIFLLLLGIFWQQLPLGMTQLASSNLLWLIGIVIIIALFWLAYKQGRGSKAGTVSTQAADEE